MGSAIPRIWVLLGIEATRVGSEGPPVSGTGHGGGISLSMGLEFWWRPGATGIGSGSPVVLEDRDKVMGSAFPRDPSPVEDKES